MISLTPNPILPPAYRTRVPGTLALLGLGALAISAGPLPEPLAEDAPLVWADFDGDGLEDAASVDATGAVRLLRNAGDGTLVEVSLESGVHGIEGARFVTWGRGELFVGTDAGPSRLLRYVQGSFVDVAASVGLDHEGTDYSARWLDYDRDGRLDLHVVSSAGHFLYHALEGSFERVDLTDVAGFPALNPVLAAGPRPFVDGTLDDAPSGTGAGADDRRRGDARSLVRESTGGREPRPAGPTSGGGSAGLGGPPSPQCMPQIADNSGGACVRASRQPALGLLYPLSMLLNVHPGTGFVGMGTNAPQGALHIAKTGSVVLRLEADTNNVGETDQARIEMSQDGNLIHGFLGYAYGTNTLNLYGTSDASVLSFGTENTERLRIDADGLVVVRETLEIRGGADIVEGFESSCGPLEPGTVVVIDSTRPGALTCSSEAYDQRVAGVVSGAGGVQPGLHLGQDGVLDGDTPVAMTGRVYVKCSAENGPIVPGDRLTTAALAGHAMRASDRIASDGAVIGKAMSALDADTGLVLVLVNLQ